MYSYLLPDDPEVLDLVTTIEHEASDFSQDADRS
jgi:hypothetical protein